MLIRIISLLFVLSLGPFEAALAQSADAPRQLEFELIYGRRSPFRGENLSGDYLDFYESSGNVDNVLLGFHIQSTKHYYYGFNLGYEGFEVFNGHPNPSFGSNQSPFIRSYDQDIKYRGLHVAFSNRIVFGGAKQEGVVNITPLLSFGLGLSSYFSKRVHRTENWSDGRTVVSDDVEEGDAASQFVFAGGGLQVHLTRGWGIQTLARWQRSSVVGGDFNWVDPVLTEFQFNVGVFYRPSF